MGLLKETRKQRKKKKETRKGEKTGENKEERDNGDSAQTTEQEGREEREGDVKEKRIPYLNHGKERKREKIGGESMTLPLETHTHV